MLTPPLAETPIIKQILFGMTQFLVDMEETSCAVALAVSWAGYIRSSEFFNLSARDVALPAINDSAISNHPQLVSILLKPRQALYNLRQFETKT